MNKLKTIKKKEIAGAILLLAIFILPIISLAGSCDEIFVNDNISGKQDGSYDHPYGTISKAIEKAEGKTKIIVKGGTYKENIIIPPKVKIIGKDKRKTIIKAKDNSKPTVTLKNKSEIMKVTINGGRYGVKIKDGGKGKITIVDCHIKKAKRDGINIDRGGKDSQRKVNIINSKIYENGKSGIYSQRRRLVIMDSEIFDNELDGIDMEESSKAYISKNKIYKNDGVGIKIRLDNANSTIRKNDIFKNEKDGIEVRSGGHKGEITIKKNTIVKNERFGIVKLLNKNYGNTTFSGLIIEDSNNFWKNDNGNMSDIIKIFKH